MALKGRNDLQKHAVPGLDVPFWIMVKTKQLQLLGLLLAAAWACCCCCCGSCCCCCCWWCCWSWCVTLPSEPTRNQLQSAAPMPSKQLHNKSPSGRLRNSKTPWPWRTERPPKTCCPGAWRPFCCLTSFLDSGKNKVGPAACSCWPCCCCCWWWCCWSWCLTLPSEPTRNQLRPFWILVKTKRV